jgi:Fe2+ or Zn2+ uptake regulation protein
MREHREKAGLNTRTKQAARRNTLQRELIKEAICLDQHPSAREIFEAVSKKQPMSFGTVYRNLQILEEAGEIVPVQAAPDSIRYDRRRDRHYHLYCKSCGGVFDIPIPYRSRLDQAAAAGGFTVESHSICFKGLCHQCQKKNRQRL